MACIFGMNGKQIQETLAPFMDSNGEIGLITIMDNKLIRFSKSLIKSEAILHREESLSVLGMLPTYLMKAFPLRKMCKRERWLWHHVMQFFNFLFHKENCHVSSIKEVVIHSWDWDSILLHIAY